MVKAAQKRNQRLSMAEALQSAIQIQSCVRVKSVYCPERDQFNCFRDKKKVFMIKKHLLLQLVTFAFRITSCLSKPDIKEFAEPLYLYGDRTESLKQIKAK